MWRQHRREEILNLQASILCRCYKSRESQESPGVDNAAGEARRASLRSSGTIKFMEKWPSGERGSNRTSGPRRLNSAVRRLEPHFTCASTSTKTPASARAPAPWYSARRTRTACRGDCAKPGLWCSRQCVCVAHGSRARLPVRQRQQELLHYSYVESRYETSVQCQTSILLVRSS